MTDRSRLPYLVAGLAYVGLRLAAFLPTSPRTFPDTGTYLRQAAEPLLSLRFIAGPRPWTVPLLYKLLPDSGSARAATQLGISIVCWLVLAGVVAWCVRRPGLRPVAFCLVLLFSLSVWITQWDSVLISESLAISLTALLVAGWLALLRAPSRWTVAAVLAATTLWTFTRDTSLYVSVLVVPFVVVWAALPGRRRERIGLAAGLVVVFVAGALLASRAVEPERWKRPLRNVIGTRVLTSPSELRYFHAHDMPTPEELLALAGKELGTTLGPASALGDDPRLAPFRAWLHDHGRQTLTRYLVTHPYRALEPVVRERHLLLATDPHRVIASYRAPGTDPLLPAPVAAAAYPPSVRAAVVWLAIVGVAAAWLAWRRAFQPVWLVPAIALLLQIPLAALVWNGDSSEIPRHAVLVGVMTRLSLVLLTIFLVDAALRARSAAADA